MSRASGAERRRRLAAKVAEGVVPARRVTHFQLDELQQVVRDELAEQRAFMAAQQEASKIRRERARQRPLGESGEVLLVQYAGVALNRHP